MEQRPYRVGIIGSYGGLNLGDEAILECIIKELRSSLPVEITVFSRNTADTLARHPIERAIPVRSMMRQEVLPEIRRLDLLILGGGGILFDAEARIYLREVEMAIDNHIPVMVYAVGAGPLKDPNVQKFVRDCLNAVQVITVRERKAKQVLEEIGVHRDILITADPALLLTPEPLPAYAHVREHLDRRLVGFSVREPGGAAPDIDVAHYHGVLANAADYMVDRFDADVLFVPMERGEADMQHAHAVISKMLRAQHANVLKDIYTPGQILALMDQFCFAVGMRLHFLIFAALQHIPFVALPYASKVAGFIEELKLEMPPVHLVNAGRLIAFIDQCWDNQCAKQGELERLLGALKQKARENNQILVDLLRQQGKKAA